MTMPNDSNPSPPTPPVLSADHPRTDPSEDLLGYAPFARMLAHSVLRGSPAAGLVVGIYGEWGLGKTTLLNFIEYFTTADAGDDAPIIVRFNPWWFSGREDLLRRFFKEFEIAVLKSRVRNAKARKILLGGLEKLGNALTIAPSAWVATAGKGVAALAKLGQQPPDVVGLKDQLHKALSAEAMRVIVLVDDIDRLLPSEMIDVFRLVRSVGDFPNVHYVLAFERQVVVKALTDECHTNGERYLEKIIQVPFELPHPSATTLHGLFTSRLQHILSDTEEELFDAQYWTDVFLNGIAPFLRTPRDVMRLLNALAVVYPSVRNEVNPVDFVAIETLRIFAPSAYEVVRSTRTHFFGLLPAVAHSKEDLGRFHEEWLEGIARNREAVRALIVRLFPAVGALLAKASKSSPSDVALRTARRICTEHMFDVYFRYTLESGISRVAFLACLESRADELGATLRRFGDERLDDGHTKLRRFLDMLRDELVAGKHVNNQNVLEQLCLQGDAVIAKARRAFGFEIPDDFLLVFVIEKLLEGMRMTERRSALQKALEPAGASVAARVVTTLGAQHGRHGERGNMPEERTLASEADVDALELFVRQRLEKAGADGTLWAAPILPLLLLDWKRLGGEPQMRDAVRKWSADDANLITILCSLKGPSRLGREAIDMGTASAILDLDDTNQRAKRLLGGHALDEKARIALQLLVDDYSAAEKAKGNRSTSVGS